MSLQEIVKNIKSSSSVVEEKNIKISGFEEDVLENVSWKIVFFTMLGFSLGIALLSKKIFEYYKQIKIFNNISMKFFELFLYCLVFNLFILTFSLSNYVSKLKSSGIKGQKGLRGEKGMRGKDTKCDVCTKKYDTVKQNKPKKKTMFVEDISDILAEEPNIPNGWNQSPLEMSDTRFDDIGRGEDVVSYKDDFKFLIGVILSYNQTSRIIESLQFIKMTNENKQELLGDISGKPITNTTQQINFTCPNNFAVTKMDVNLGYDEKKKCYVVRGLQLGYSHTETGKPNKETFSIGSKSADVNIINISYNAGFKENNGNTYPSFINGLAILSNEDFVENIKVTYVNTNWR